MVKKVDLNTSLDIMTMMLLDHYFNGYNDNDVIRPLCIKPLQMIGYVKHFDSKKTCHLRLVITPAVRKVY